MQNSYLGKPYVHPKDDPDILRPEQLLHYVVIKGQKVDRIYWQEDFAVSPADKEQVPVAVPKEVPVARLKRPARELVGASSSIDTEF